MVLSLCSKQTMNKRYDNRHFFEAYPNSMGGYTKLVQILCNNSLLQSCHETSIEFEDVPDHEFTMRCYDGLAVGVSTDGTINIVVEYPKKIDLTAEVVEACLLFVGKKPVGDADSVNFNSLTLGEVMLSLGKPTLIHHITK